MKRIWILVIASSALALLASGVLPSHINRSSTGCGEGDSPPALMRLDDMDVHTPLYSFYWNGRFVRRDPGARTETLLSDRGFESMPTVEVSADGRWLSYSGVLRDKPLTQYWLYDRETGVDRLVMEHPAWGGSIPIFSPDSRYLVIAANYDSRWRDASQEGIYVFSTETLRPLRLKSAIDVPPEAAWTDVEWSRDGTRLLAMTRDYRPGHDKNDYRSWRVGSFKPVPIEGGWRKDAQNGHHVWLDAGQEIPIFERPRIQGMGGNTLERSPDGRWTPRLEEHGDGVTLTLTSQDGQTRRAATSKSDMCEGYAIAVIGWLDAGHLVYREPGDIVRVYEPATDRTAPLLGRHESSIGYSWR